MIKDDLGEYWIWVVPSSGKRIEDITNAEEYLEHWGKWLIFASREQLDKLAALLDKHVETDKIASVKYGRRPGKRSKVTVMCVYCDDRERDGVWEILKDLGITKKIWKYDRQTLEDWAPGGRLRKEAEEAEVQE